MNKNISTTMAAALISVAIALFSGCNTETDYGYSVRFVYENSSECDIRVMQVYTSPLLEVSLPGTLLR